MDLEQEISIAEEPAPARQERLAMRERGAGPSSPEVAPLPRAHSAALSRRQTLASEQLSDFSAELMGEGAMTEWALAEVQEEVGANEEDEDSATAELKEAQGQLASQVEATEGLRLELAALSSQLQGLRGELQAKEAEVRYLARELNKATLQTERPVGTDEVEPLRQLLAAESALVDRLRRDLRSKDAELECLVGEAEEAATRLRAGTGAMERQLEVSVCVRCSVG